MRAKVVRSIYWFEPRWAFEPRLKSELLSIWSLRRRLWVKVLAITMLMNGIVSAVLQVLQPSLLATRVVGGLFLSGGTVVLFILCFLAANYALLAALPPRIDVSRRRLLVRHGMRGLTAMEACLERAQIVITFEPEHRAWLHITYRTRGGSKTSVLGITESVSLPVLAALLGMEECQHGVHLASDRDCEMAGLQAGD